MQKLFLTVSVFLFTLRCGHPTSQSSELTISNGVETSPAEFPEAVLIVGADGINPILNKLDPTKRPPDAYVCTGIHVSKNIVLTAARCAMCPSGKKLYQRKCKAEELSVYDHSVDRVVFHPKFRGIDPTRYDPNDLALLHLKDPLPLPYAKFCEQAPKSKERVVMIGFGKDESNRITEEKRGNLKTTHNVEEKTGNRRRLGNNVVDRVTDDGIFITAEEERTYLDPLGEKTWFTDGDVGGPLFRGKCVTGVASSFKLPLLANETKVENFYVNMLLDENISFVRSKQ